MKKTIILSLFLVLILAGCSGKSAMTILEPEEAKAKAEEFIKEELEKVGAVDTVIEIKEVTEDSGNYKLAVSLDNKGNKQEVESYISKDGTKFFPQFYDLEKEEEEVKEANPTPEVKPVATLTQKQDKPKVELFVMSHCPFGTQMEKAILPALDVLGDKIDFDLKFCDYAMHGEKELDEQLIQYCINKEQKDKLSNYLKCFLNAEDTDGCLAQSKVDTAKLNACVASTDKEFKVKEMFADQSTWLNGKFPIFNVDKVDVDKYGIKGSPNLVINGEKISVSRDANSILQTICSGFNNAPEECNAPISSETPAPGFGYGGTGTDTNASCN